MPQMTLQLHGLAKVRDTRPAGRHWPLGLLGAANRAFAKRYDTEPRYPLTPCVPLTFAGHAETTHKTRWSRTKGIRVSCRSGGDSSVREIDLDAGAAEVDHRDERFG